MKKGIENNDGFYRMNETIIKTKGSGHVIEVHLSSRHFTKQLTHLGS